MCEPTDTRATDADVLVELDGARTGPRSHSKRTISASSRADRRTSGRADHDDRPSHDRRRRKRSPRSTTHSRGPDGGAPSDITTQVHDRRVAFAAIGRALAPDAVVTTCASRPIGSWAPSGSPHRCVDRCDSHPRRWPGPSHRGGLSRDATVWVGVCIPETRGHWLRTPDAYDRLRGCAGWVPDCRAATVGVLVPGAHTSLDVLAGDRARQRRVDARRARRRRGSAPATGPGTHCSPSPRSIGRARRERRCSSTSWTRRTISTTPSPPRSNVRSTIMPGRSSPSACCWRWREPPAIGWLARDPDRERRPRRLGPMDPDGQAPNRSLRGSSV